MGEVHFHILDINAFPSLVKFIKETKVERQNERVWAHI